MGRTNFTLLIIVFCSLPIAAQSSSLGDDDASIATNIKALYSPDGEVRAAAAKQLRQIVAKYPSGTINIRSDDGGEAFWMEKLNQIAPGMTKAEVDKILPVFPEGPEVGGFGSGQTHSDSYRLDYTWSVRIPYRNTDTVTERPILIKRVLSIYVTPSPEYSGSWICWHVNGQKSFEIQFKDGKNDGVFTSFHDNGQKSFEQHYVGHVAEGSDTGWFPDGQLMYTGKYRNGKQDGRWVHFYHNGTKQSERNYKNGIEHGLSAGWSESGQILYEMNYENGVRHGIQAAWNEQGVLQYKREYRNGKLIE